ncbi:MAG: hypothetical protein JPMHGGIA_02262 [Saprospiraceae bacterium]|nr:hypothetical protein [Saprospiraceae bacterium]
MVSKIVKGRLRNIWKHEANDFTAWLKANIGLLYQVIDFLNSNVKREQSTGNLMEFVVEDGVYGFNSHQRNKT